jgi:hypothetical protein
LAHPPVRGLLGNLSPIGYFRRLPILSPCPRMSREEHRGMDGPCRSRPLGMRWYIGNEGRSSFEQALPLSFVPNTILLSSTRTSISISSVQIGFEFVFSGRFVFAPPLICILRYRTIPLSSTPLKLSTHIYSTRLLLILIYIYLSSNIISHPHNNNDAHYYACCQPSFRYSHHTTKRSIPTS